MKKKYKVVYISSSRADYGIVRRYLRLLCEDKQIDFSVVATGSLVEKEYGNQASMIIKDGFKVKKIKIDIKNTTNRDVIHCMSEALDKFGNFFEKNVYDLVIILGDRYEMLPVAIAASMHNIKMLHIHGGEATYGNYDEFIRHSITKMSLYHFTSCEEYRKRVIQLGENPNRVYNLGSLGAENCRLINKKIVKKEILELPKKKYFVVLVHPETLHLDDTKKNVTILLESLIKYIKNYSLIFIGSNSDTASDVFRESIKRFVNNNNKNCRYYENLNTDSYHYLLKNSVCLIGNSSSGIIEAPSLKTITVNIGKRQDGRIKPDSVIDVMWNKKQIMSTIDNIILGKIQIKEYHNPYLPNNKVSNNYYKHTVSLLKKEERNVKYFYDIQ